MTRLVSTMSVVLAVLCMTTTIARAWARPSDIIKPFSNGELADIRGGTPARYCWPVPYPSVPDVECDGVSTTEKQGLCGKSTMYMYPEQCVDNSGNENCDSETQVSNAVYSERYLCKWEREGFGNWYCQEDDFYAKCCTTITTSFTCYYETTSDCGAPIRCP